MKRITLLFFVICVLLLFWLATANAGGPDIEQEVKIHGGDVNVPVGGSDSVAIGYGPDNDINDCMAHWSAILITVPKRNKFCERQEFVQWAEATEKHTPASVRIQCTGPLGSEVFGSTDECIDTFLPKPSVPVSGPCDEPDPCEVERERVADINYAQQEQITQQEIELESLEERLARIERNNRLAAQRAQERREIAQQTLERLTDESER
jgi:hypothetical protein